MEIQVWHIVAGIVLLVFGPPGGVAIAVKVTMNGIKKDIHEICKDLDEAVGERKELSDQMAGVRERLSVIEDRLRRD